MRKRSEISAESIASESEPKPDPNPPIPRAALERFADFSPGDTISIALGREMYSPVKYRNFEIGPFSATVVVRPGETGADAAMRVYRVLLELQEAEFQIAWGRHKERLKLTGASVSRDE